jgi:molybdopterin-guanine dinucleotide biosynthesis protein MobB
VSEGTELLPGTAPIPTLSIVGRSKSGKTTVLERIIIVLKARGYNLATVKHHAHPGFEIDVPGKDTWRHAQAGSDHVVIAAPDKVAEIRKVSREPSLDEIIAGIQGVDLILTEGYLRADKPKVEVFPDEPGLMPIAAPDQLLAVVSVHPVRVEVPQYQPDNCDGLVDFLERELLDGRQNAPRNS